MAYLVEIITKSSAIPRDRWTIKRKGESFHYSAPVLFDAELEDDLTILVDVSKLIQGYAISFNVDSYKGSAPFDKRIELRIISTLVEMVKHFVNRVNPESITINFASDSRRKLYLRLSRRYARGLGYVVHIDPYDRTIIMLYRL